MASCDSASFIIRTMRPEEVAESHQLPAGENWPLPLEKYSFMYKCFPDAFYVAVTDTGEVAGTMCVCPIFDKEYWLGNFVIKKTYRQRGLGKRFLREILELHSGFVISLLSAPGVDQFYLNAGFQYTQPQQKHDVYNIVVDCDRIQQWIKTADADNILIMPFDEGSLDELVAYDQEVRGNSCKGYLDMQVKCYTMFLARDSTGHLVGYGAGFGFRDNLVLDAIFADSDATALCLVMKLLDAFPERTNLILEVLSARPFLAEFGHITSTFTYNRFSIGCPTSVQLQKVYNTGGPDYTY